MKYIERVLQPGETVVYTTTLHWLIYLKSAGFLILAILFLGASLVASGGFQGQGVVVGLWIVAAVLGLLALYDGIKALLRQTTTELAVTDRRVIYKTGIFQRYTMEMNRSKVETVGVEQSVLGRLLNYGTVIVRGTGGSFEPIRHIHDPLSFRNHITAE